MLKICSIGIIIAIISILVKTYRQEFSIHTRLSGTLIIFGAVMLMLVPIFDYLERMVGQALPLEYMEILIKSLGVAYLTQICSDFCCDCGEKNIASAVDIAGKIEILILSLPLIEKIINMSEEVLQW